MDGKLYVAAALVGLTSCAALASLGRRGHRVDGWLGWRGSQQRGVSFELRLPERIRIDGENHLWSYPLPGRGTPVVAGERVYALGYEGEGAELQELLVCLDASDGRRIWEHRFNDFLSDIIYDRYSIGSPTIDPETGDVFVLSSAGLLTGFTASGKLRWQRSLMSELGRMTFPNGRTGAPLIDDGLVIVHVISSNWGSQGPARDRFYAFDAESGDLVWGSTPGTAPKDSSFSFPVLGWEGGRRVLYSGTGCGHVVCIDARTGDPIWRYRVSIGGVNSSVVLHGDSVIAIHGRENIDASTIGRMVSIRTGEKPDSGKKGPKALDSSCEVWRNDLGAFTSSPVLIGNRVYQTVRTGDLCCIDAETGEVLWREKLAPDQLHASPVAADGKLYVPMNNGRFYVIWPSDAGARIIETVQLEGNCLGAPAIAAGRIYVHTTEKLYCFGSNEGALPARPRWRREEPIVGEATHLQILPADVLLRPGDEVSFRGRGLDANGSPVIEECEGLEWRAARLDVSVDSHGVLTVPAGARPGAGLLEASGRGLQGTARIRIVPGLPFSEDFEAFELETHPKELGVEYAHPPSYWIGARLKWEVRELNADKVLAKTIDNNLFQRSTVFFGHPEMSGYTFQIDVMSDGNRRTMSSAGVINQRYLIQLKGNHQELEVSSNMERIKVSVPFRWRAGAWYTLKARVDVAEDGSGVVRAKAWKRGEPEPEAWSIEVPHRHAHMQGSPGLFGFAPQSRFRVYLDNISVTPNE